MYWPDRKLLMLSDLHLGKAGHFRKHGIPIPTKVHVADLRILHALIEEYEPQEVMLLGDLFHSVANLEWADFLHFLEAHEEVAFTLVEGNHDILEEYPAALKVVKKLEIGPFSFTHIKEESPLFNISGHIHPGVMIRGKGRQGLVMPCFLFSDTFGLLPAFGQFTGIKKIRPQKQDKVFAVAENQVIELV